MQTISNVHDFLNSHWEFTFIAIWFFNWLFYRQGYKQGRRGAAKGKGK
jgi:hypothetical protein